MRIKIMTLAMAGLLATSTMFGASQAQAQLPDVASVAPGEATDADGTYVVSTINKRITIENGRAYVIDPWTQALIFRIKSGMVTLQNFRQTGPDTFEADDLPMMGKVVFNRQPNGTLQGVVQGAFGEAKYALVPTDYATIGDAPSGGGTPTIAKDRIYKLHVSNSRCVGTDLLRKTYGGVFNVSLKDPNGNRMTSRDRNFEVKCTKKGPRKQNYKFYDAGPGALTITVPAGANNVTGMRIGGKNTRGKNVTFDRAHSSLLMRTINEANLLNVGQTLKDDVHLTGKSGNARLYVTLALQRIQ
ncbi:hypothetical protein [Erythrobacter sp. MTPC3]|uniref:hypothetical protein n=1 Tax=Erythrobacter sp. MTPC3 TaxID=3056564 RepID=UPI0036F19ED6